MQWILNITKALSDENRLRLIYSLREEELCLCQLIELLELAPSTVSKHMSILKQAGLVRSRKEGRWVYYSLPSSGQNQKLKSVIDWVISSIEKEAQGKSDKKRLDKILKQLPEDLCKRQKV